jgi:hypothetical protein
VISAPALLRAEAEDPEQLIRLGNELRRKGDDSRAHGYFQRAYEIVHTARTAAQLGLADQSVGAWPEAEAHLSEALATSDPWVRDHKDTLLSARTAVREHLGQISVVGPPADATIAIAGGPAQKLPTDGVVWVSPGETTLHLEAADREPVNRTVTVAAHQNLRVEVDLPARKGAARPSATVASGGATAATPLAPAPEGAPAASVVSTAAPDHPGRTARIAGIAVAGVGVGLDVAGILLRGVASSKLSAIQAESAMGTNYDPQYGNWQTYDRLSVGLLVGGTAAIAAGAAIYLLNMNHASSADAAGAPVSVGFAPNVGGGAFHLVGRF